jgi:SNF2 family DNA or RNA helicase
MATAASLARQSDPACGYLYKPRLELRDYQCECLSQMDHKKAFAIFHAMRCGKTATLLADFGRKQVAGEVTCLLVVAPAGCYRVWEEEISKHLDESLRDQTWVFTWKSGMGKGDMESLSLFLNYTACRIFLVNVESLSSSRNIAREVCKKFLSCNSAMMVVDEATTIKNVTAKRTKFINQVLSPLAKYRRILSGLPTPRSPLDLFGEFEFLDKKILGHDLFITFQAKYAYTKRHHFPLAKWPTTIVTGYRDNIGELAELIAPYSHRVEFRPDIPSTYSIREVKMTKEQAEIYSKVKEEATARLNEEGDHVTATQVITQILRLHQILCGHVGDENQKIHSIPEKKTEQLLELLEEYSGKAVIWCSYDHDVRKVSSELATEYDESLIMRDSRGDPVVDDYGRVKKVSPSWPNGVVARFWGGNVATREEEESRFQEDPRCRFMVASPGAGGRGRRWEMADLAVYYSSTDNLEHRDQSEARILGVEKHRSADYVDLICRGTVEEKILKALRSKIDLASIITGDSWREWVM